MMSDFINEMYEKLKNDEALGAFRFKRENDGHSLGYPIDSVLVVIGSENADNMSFLLGYEDFEVVGERLVVTVMVNEETGSEFCENCAKTVIGEILKLDDSKMITGISVEKCMYDKNHFLYKITVKFSLREFAAAGEG